ncbi:hypothetical protein FACS1894181_10900 [Bacteroidia bacterium]|nr:hypothetical protein FACS1894181_10900 [Bacteroidia bacterium]
MKKHLSTIIIWGIALFLSASPVLAQGYMEQMAQDKAKSDSVKAVRAAEQAVYDAQNTKYHRVVWLVIGVSLLVAGSAFYVRNKATVLSIIQLFTGGFRTKGDVTTLESKKILVGAVYSSQQSACLNTLKADIGSKLYTILGDWWGIHGRDSAIETLDYLKNKSFAYYFPTVWKAFHAGSDEERKAIIIDAMTTQEDAEKAYEQTYNLLESVEALKTLKIIRQTSDIEKYGVVGWDAGRLVFIARICHDAQYITEQEAWEYIDAAYGQAQKAFGSWEELAKSYLIGRFIWRGKEADDGMDGLADNLVNKPKSPWKQVAWKG